MTPEDQKIIQSIRLYHESKSEIIDATLDRWLGLKMAQTEPQIDYDTLNRQFGFEQYIYEGTPYTYIRKFLRVLGPTEGMKIYDLGAGYGRVVVYGAITHPRVDFYGIEIVPNRAKQAQNSIERFGLENAEIIQANVLDQPLSDGDIFFLFNPFFRDTLIKIIERLHGVSKAKQITVITWGGTSNDLLSCQRWLKEIKTGYFQHIQFFRS